MQAEDLHLVDVEIVSHHKIEPQTAVLRRHLRDDVRVPPRAKKLAQALAFGFDVNGWPGLQRQTGGIIFQHVPGFVDDANGRHALPFEFAPPDGLRPATAGARQSRTAPIQARHKRAYKIRHHYSL